MLYPEFDELVAYKDLKFERSKSHHRSSSISLGGQHSHFKGQGLEFDSVRQYVPGDDIRNIDWKVTARTSSPHLKIFQEEKLRHIVLCVDVNAHMRFGTRKTFKSIQAARIASILGWQAIAHQDLVSACLYGNVPQGVEFFAPNLKKSSFSQILKRFSSINHENYHVSLNDALRRLGDFVKTGSIVYLISDFMDLKGEKELDVRLNHLKKKCDLVIISVNDQADKTITSVGNICVSNLKEQFLINTDLPSFRKAYENQWEENRKNLYEKVHQFKIPLIELTTENDIKNDLLTALKSLSRRRS